MVRPRMIQGSGAKTDSLGVTLIEVMIAVTLFTVAFGAIYMVARTTLVNTAFHDAQIAAQEQARRGLQLMVRELRQARGSSLLVQTMPSDQLTFEVPSDADGNGTPLDAGGYLESVGTVTYMRDWNDLNGDGVAADQLVRLYQNGTGSVADVSVITNDIVPNEDVNWDGVLDAGEDTNASRFLERGIWFERTGNLLRITVDVQKRVGSGRLVWATVRTDVHPRN